MGHRGQTRGRELTRQLLQRPRLSGDGLLVAFSSTARNLVAEDTNGAEDVFVRVTAPARARIVRGPRGVIRSSRPRLVLSADDRQVKDFICQLDGVRIACGRRTRLPRLAPGPHLLQVLAGGPGINFDPKGLVVRRFRVAR